MSRAQRSGVGFGGKIAQGTTVCHPAWRASPRSTLHKRHNRSQRPSSLMLATFGAAAKHESSGRGAVVAMTADGCYVAMTTDGRESSVIRASHRIPRLPRAARSRAAEAASASAPASIALAQHPTVFPDC